MPTPTYMSGCNCASCQLQAKIEAQNNAKPTPPPEAPEGGLAGMPEETPLARRVRRVFKTKTFQTDAAVEPAPEGIPVVEEKEVSSALTASQWEKMSEKAQWDIKVALRGPDSYYGETLKWYTTSVIRGRCRKVFRVGGTVNQDLKAVVLPDNRHGDITYKKAGKVAWNAAHFLEHIEAAASWLNIPILYIPTETWHEVMQMGNQVAAGQAILQAAEAKERKPDPKAIAEVKRHVEKKLGEY